MSCCASICVLNIPENTPLEFLSPNGELFFDFTGDIELNEKIAKLSSIGRVNEFGVVDSTLAPTLKNKWIVSRFSKNGFNADPITIRLEVDGVQVTTIDSLIVQTISENGEFDIRFEFIGGWLDRAKKTKLCEIGGYAPYIFSEAIVDLYSSQQQFDAGAAGIVFPHARYGGNHRFNTTTNQYELVFIDLRPHFYVFTLLKNALCYCGVNFTCDFLEKTDIGRNLIAYLSGGEKWSNPLTDTLYPRHLSLDGCNQYKFKAIKSVDQTLTGLATPPASGLKILFDNDSVNGGYDTGGALTPGGALFGNGGFWDTAVSKIYHVRGIWDYNITLYLNSNIQVTVEIYVELDGVAFDLGQSSPTQTVIIKPGIDQVVKFTTRMTHLTPSVGYAVVINAFNTAAVITVRAGSSIEGNCVNLLIGNRHQISTNSPVAFTLDQPSSNTITFPQSYIDEDISVIDLLSAVMHLINGQLYYNLASNTLALYTDLTTNYSGKEITGFLESPIGDFTMTTRELCDTRTTTVDIDDDVPCSIVLGFKETTDYYIKEKLGDDTEPFERTINIKTSYPLCNIDSEENRNPLFEPTLESEYTEVKPTNTLIPLTSFVPVVVPTMLDNGTSDLSTNIGVRISVYYGPVRQQQTTTINRKFKRFWGGATVDFETIYYASQQPTTTFTETTVAKFMAGKRPTFTYGISADSLYKFHRNSIISNILGRKVQAEYLVSGMVQWSDLDFRNKYIISDEFGIQKRYALQEKLNYSPCGDRKATLVFKEIDSAICLCPYPCDGDVTTQEIGKHEKFLNDGTYTYQINSFKLNGVELLSGPYLYSLNISAASFIPLGVGQYMMPDVDALNTFFSIFEPTIKLFYADKYNRMIISFPSCWAFTLEIVDTPANGGDSIRLTQDGISEISFNSGVNWYKLGDAFLGAPNSSLTNKLGAPSNIQYSNICDGL